MISYVDWVDKEKFWVRGSYDPITDQAATKGPLKLVQHQREILSHCMTPVLVGDQWTFPYTTIIYSCPKKSGKTTIGGSVGAYLTDVLSPGTQGYCIAGDYEHAMGRMFEDVRFDAQEPRTEFPNGKLIQLPRRDLLTFNDDKTIQALAQEYKSASGSRHAFTLWDELWTYVSDTSRRMWVEMTPIKLPTVPISIRFVATYAGFEGESDLLWDLYQKIVMEGEPVKGLEHIQHENGNPTCWSNGRMFAYWDSIPRMPWQTEDYYREQMASGMKPNEYARLHENRWTTGSEPFMPIKWYDSVAVLDKSLEYDVKNERRALPVVVGVDGSTKHDSTALVGVQYDFDNDILTQAFHKIWTPTPEEPMDFEHTLEQYLIDRKDEGFNISAIVYDPRDLHRSMMRLQQIFDPGIIHEYTQTVSNMVKASESLYDLFKNQKIWVYYDEECRAHLRYAQAEDKGQGFRIVKPKKAAHHHTDFAIALAMASYWAFVTHGFDISKPIKLEVPFSEGSQWEAEDSKNMLEQQNWPAELRSAGVGATEEEFDDYWDQYVLSARE